MSNGTWTYVGCDDPDANDDGYIYIPSVEELNDGDQWVDDNAEELDGSAHDYEYDGQPDEAQEWFDFDPDC